MEMKLLRKPWEHRWQVGLFEDNKYDDPSKEQVGRTGKNVSVVSENVIAWKHRNEWCQDAGIRTRDSIQGIIMTDKNMIDECQYCETPLTSCQRQCCIINHFPPDFVLWTPSCSLLQVLRSLCHLHALPHALTYSLRLTTDSFLVDIVFIVKYQIQFGLSQLQRLSSIFTEQNIWSLEGTLGNYIRWMLWLPDSSEILCTNFQSYIQRVDLEKPIILRESSFKTWNIKRTRS